MPLSGGSNKRGRFFWPKSASSSLGPAGREETNRETDFPHADATLLGDAALMAEEIQLWADFLPRPISTPMSRGDLERMARVHADVIRALNNQETLALAGGPLREVDLQQAAEVFTAELQQRLASQILGAE